MEYKNKARTQRDSRLHIWSRPWHWTPHLSWWWYWPDSEDKSSSLVCSQTVEPGHTGPGWPRWWLLGEAGWDNQQGEAETDSWQEEARPSPMVAEDTSGPGLLWTWPGHNLAARRASEVQIHQWFIFHWLFSFTCWNCAFSIGGADIVAKFRVNISEILKPTNIA